MLFEKYEVDNKVLEIFHDDSPISPRSWDNLGTIVAWHRNYNLSEEDYNECRDFLEAKTYQHYESDEGIENASDQRLMDLFEKDNIILPVYMYEHSGIALSTTSFSCRWDSGLLGYIFVSKERIRNEYGVKRITKKVLEKVESVLKSEIDVYGDYLNGSVYGYVLKDDKGEEVDSCWGFYGYDFKNNGMMDYLPNEFEQVL
jgi:hypothetical protein